MEEIQSADPCARQTARILAAAAAKLSQTPADQVSVLCDFDGTISVEDVQVGILDAFARADWRDAERAILATGAKSSAYLPANYVGFRGSLAEVTEHIADHAEMDPAFPGFAAFCSAKGWRMEIVSDGLSIYIDALLARHGLEIPRFCNRAVFAEGGVSLEFPNYSLSCGKCGSCKLSRVQAARAAGATFIVYAGDGISDECPAAHVDLVFAKGSLAAFCARERLDHVRFSTFADIREGLESMVNREPQAELR